MSTFTLANQYSSYTKNKNKKTSGKTNLEPHERMNAFPACCALFKLRVHASRNCEGF